MLDLIKRHFNGEFFLCKSRVFLNNINGLVRVDISTGQVLQVHLSGVNLTNDLQVVSKFLLYFAEMSALEPLGLQCHNNGHEAAQLLHLPTDIVHE